MDLAGSAHAASLCCGLAVAGIAGGGDTPIEGQCHYDCDGSFDGVVGIADFLRLLAEWGTEPGSCDPCFGPVGIADLLGMLAAWGPCPPVTCGPGGDGETCAAAIPLAAGTVFGTTSDNTPSGAVSCCAGGELIDEWYCFFPPGAGTLVLSTCNPGTDFDARLAVSHRCSGYEVCGGIRVCEDGSVLTRFAWPDLPVLIRVTGEAGAVGDFELTATFTPVPEACNLRAGECCVANGTPGCDHLYCCDAVCRLDPFCCDVAWDEVCVGLMALVCNNCAFAASL